MIIDNTCMQAGACLCVASAQPAHYTLSLAYHRTCALVSAVISNLVLVK